jgi:curved DNA-binding protein CbpA
VGVPPEAPRDMIAAACRRRIAKLEGVPGEESKAEIYAVREAWSILGDEKLRAGYDASLAPPPGAGDGASPVAGLATEIDPGSIGRALFKPRRLLPEMWERYRRVVFAIVFLGLFALSAAWNQSSRMAMERRIEDANYRAEHGLPRPGPAQETQPAATAPAEPFSAEKFEQELKEREAAIQEKVANEQAAKEDEFRDKLQRENDPYAGRRRPRSRYR